MSFCARTKCDIYREKRFCRKAEEKERSGVCDCRHAVYPCGAGDFCSMAKTCAQATEETKLRYDYIARQIAFNAGGKSMKIRMLCTVRPDLMFAAEPGTVLRAGEEYEATANKHGAVCGICENGHVLGVKPGEFEFVKAPDWLLEIWKAYEKNGKG